MAYLKPPAFTSKVFNRLAMTTGMSGTETLAVPGRSTGNEQTIPVIPVDVNGTRYIVSTRGESEWVRNVRTAGAVEIRDKQGAQRYRATEVSENQRPPVIDAYRAKAGRTVTTYWKKLPDPADHPVFRLEPAEG
jgi:hypothetical protein